jgi:hypothetical protein
MLFLIKFKLFQIQVQLRFFFPNRTRNMQRQINNSQDKGKLTKQPLSYMSS